MEQVSRRVYVFNPDFPIYTPEPSKFVDKQIGIGTVEYLKSNQIRGVSPVVLDGLKYLSISLGGQNMEQVVDNPNKLQKLMHKVARKPLIPLDVNVLTINCIHPKLPYPLTVQR